MARVATAEIQPVFYYDLGSPHCYLVAEQVMTALAVVPEWEPVLGPRIAETDAEPDRALIERRARELELQPVRWPQRWPPETRTAMLAATYAKQIGRAVAFSLACFRQEFAGGRDPGDEQTVLIAAAACELHPAAVLKGIALRSTADALERATARALAAGVASLPAIQIGESVFEGEEGLRVAVGTVGAAR
jgi:2-hydroxychromene-2-carboxylate isomerase